MKSKAIFRVTAASVAVVMALGAPGAVAQAAPAGPNDYIVQTVASANPVSVAASAGVAEAQLTHVFATAFLGFSATLTAAQVQSLAANPQVAAVTSDTTITAMTSQPLDVVAPARMYVNPSWGLDRIDQRPPGGDGKYSYDTTGQGVTVFVADSGIQAANAEFGGRVTGGYDFVDNDADPADCSGHGTEVASVIGGITSGVAKAVSLVPLRVLGCVDNNTGFTDGQASDLIAGLDWAVSHKPAGPAEVNISAGGVANTALDTAVNNTIAAGLPVVVAAGGSDDACATSPAKVANALTVGGTDYRDWLYLNSAQGPCIDVFAPADVIGVANFSGNPGISWNEGTSLSAAFVSGIVARTLQSSPGSTPAQVSASVRAAATPSATLAAQVANTTNLIAFIAPPVVASLPGAPSNVSATRNDAARTATLTWTTPASTGGSPITGYKVSRDGTDAVGVGAWSAVVAGTATSQTFIHLKPGVTYTLSVQAITAAGTGPAAAAKVKIPALPGKPIIGNATSGSTTDSALSITARWQPPTSGGTVSSYAVTSINQATGARKTVSASSTAQSISITGLKAGASYAVTVVALNGTGSGATSAASNVVAAK